MGKPGTRRTRRSGAGQSEVRKLRAALPKMEKLETREIKGTTRGMARWSGATMPHAEVSTKKLAIQQKVSLPAVILPKFNILSPVEISTKRLAIEQKAS